MPSGTINSNNGSSASAKVVYKQGTAGENVGRVDASQIPGSSNSFFQDSVTLSKEAYQGDEIVTPMANALRDFARANGAQIKDSQAESNFRKAQALAKRFAH